MILAFDTDSDCDESKEYYQPSLSSLTAIEASSGDEFSATTSKKRKRNLLKWKRNEAKLKRAKGDDEHILLRNKIIPRRVTGPDCLCSKKCFVNISYEDRIGLISAFNNILDKCKQDTYLGGLICVHSVSRQRSRDGRRPSKTCAVLYEIRLGTNDTLVCKKAYCSIFGIGKAVVDRIVKKIQNHIPSPTDGRG